jgi:hypothetical protein
VAGRRDNGTKEMEPPIVKITKMKNRKMTASIAIDEQVRIMGGTEIKPRPKSIIDQIKDGMKPSPTIPIIPTIIAF